MTDAFDGLCPVFDSQAESAQFKNSRIVLGRTASNFWQWYPAATGANQQTQDFRALILRASSVADL